MKYINLNRFGGLSVMMAIVLAGCSQEMPDMKTPPPPVTVMTIVPTTLVQTEELTGRVSAVRVAEIRPQVSGIVQKRLFEQGTEVRAGQPLFQINAAPFKAEADTAAAALQRAEAAFNRAKTQAARLETLVESEAISRQTYDDAVSQRDQAAAEVAQARAELARRQLDLKFATVDAPISGRIDQAVISEGSLVGPSDSNPLARVQQLDQVYVDVRQPAASLEALREAASSSHTSSKDLNVEILRSGGQPYNLKGRILFSGITVDEGTGDVLVRVLVDNQERKLLPGMFVRARITRARFADVFAVPQEAIARAGQQTTVWVLGDNNKVRRVKVELGELIDRHYRIRGGLQNGDKVIVEGLDRMSEGAEVTPRERSERSLKNQTANGQAEQSLRETRTDQSAR